MWPCNLATPPPEMEKHPHHHPQNQLHCVEDSAIWKWSDAHCELRNLPQKSADYLKNQLKKQRGELWPTALRDELMIRLKFDSRTSRTDQGWWATAPLNTAAHDQNKISFIYYILYNPTADTTMHSIHCHCGYQPWAATHPGHTSFTGVMQALCPTYLPVMQLMTC